MDVTQELIQDPQLLARIIESEQRYHALFQQITVGIAEVDLAGNFVQANQRYCEMLGYTREELLALRMQDITHPDDLPRNLVLFNALPHDGAPFTIEKRYLHKDGSVVWVNNSVAPVRDEQGRPRHTCAVCIDITARKTAEEALARSENRFRQMVEQSPLSTQIYAADGTPLRCNAAWERLFGVTLADIPDYNILRDPELAKHGMAELIARGFAGEVVVVPPIPYVPDRGVYRGQERWTGATIYPVKDAAGAVQEVVLIHEDITDRKRAEVELRRAKEAAEAANQAKDQFLAVLSHELRTPLTPVVAIVSALEQQADLPRDVRADLEVVRRNVELETRLIDDLLDLTRITKGKLRLNLEPVDVREAVNRVVEICRDDLADKRLLLMVDFPPRGCVARADSARLQQVLWNLLKNAIKFTPPGGKVTVRGACGGDGAVRVEMTDTGIGIDPAVLPKVFNAFEQGHGAGHRFGGLGLGLSISRALAEAHGGSLEASSAGRDRGATFVLKVPAAAAKPSTRDATTEVSSAAAAAALPPPPARSRVKILLVEDHADTARIMLRLLRGSNYDVEWAATIADALRAADAQRFDLIVSDLGLPDGSGIDLMRRLRGQHGLKGIALSGYGMEEDVQRSRDAGFAEHLTKPINLHALRAAIDAVVK